MNEIFEEALDQFRHKSGGLVVISSSTLLGSVPCLSLTPSQASLALIDPLVRACGITISCIVKCSLQWEGAQIESSNSKQITTRAKWRKFVVWMYALMSWTYHNTTTTQVTETMMNVWLRHIRHRVASIFIYLHTWRIGVSPLTPNIVSSENQETVNPLFTTYIN